MKIYGKLIFECKIDKSSIHNKGTYASKKIPHRRKIGSLAGTIISLKEVPKSFSSRASIALVELENKLVLDSRKFKNELCFINHSCEPNCFMRIIGNHVEIYALKEIKKGSELLLNYGLTHHDGKLKCNCGTKSCKGFI